MCVICTYNVFAHIIFDIIFEMWLSEDNSRLKTERGTERERERERGTERERETDRP